MEVRNAKIPYYSATVRKANAKQSKALCSIYSKGLAECQRKGMYCSFPSHLLGLKINETVVLIFESNNKTIVRHIPMPLLNQKAH